jgi:3-deoxy-D-manno-octulosonic-acid transferase
MRLLYSNSIFIYFVLVWLASPFNKKAANWIKNRRNWSSILCSLSKDKKTIWIHAASAGEFEQAIPLIRRIRESGLPLQIAASFYSQSGYNLFRDSGYADLFFHFPADFPQNARKLVSELNPAAAVFIRNEIWWNTLKQLKDQYVPAILINAEPVIRKGIYGWYLHRCYPLYSKIFYSNITGNTKIEQVLHTAETGFTDPALENFSADSFVLLLGSCYEKEVQLTAEAYKHLRHEFPELKLVFCPHEWDEQTIQTYQRYFEEKIECYSGGNSNGRLLFIDKMGVLKYLYRYAQAAFIGGGFGRGTHNVTEAAVYGIPVFIGPEHHKFPEILTLTDHGQVCVINEASGLQQAMLALLKNRDQADVQKEKWKQHFANAGNASMIIWKEIESAIKN